MGAITAIELTVLLMLLVWGVEIIVRGEFAFRRTPLDIVILLFCTYSVVSTLLFSEYKDASHRGLSIVLCISALYFIVVNHIRSRAQLIRLSMVILLAGFTHAFSHLVRNATGLLRASTGVMLNVGNHFAGYMVTIIPLAVAMSFVVKDTGKRILLLFAGVVMAAAMAFSLIAGALLAFLLSLGLAALLFTGSERTRKQAMILGGVAACSVLVVFWIGYRPVLSELLTVADLKTGSPAGRLSLWKSSLAMFADNPVTGTGLSTFDYIYPKYRLPDMYGRAVYAHSDWLQLLTELGIIGFVIVLCGTVVFFRSMGPWTHRPVATRHTVSLQTRGILVGGVSSIGAGLAYALVEFNFHIPAIAVLFSIIVALTVVARLDTGYSTHGQGCLCHHTASSIQHPVPSTRYRVLASICLLLVVGFSAVLILRPCIADVRYRRGMELEDDLLWDEAAGEYQSALGLCPGNGDLLYALGNVYAKRVSLTKGMEEKKWHELALDAYCQAIKLCPAKGDYRLVLGNLYEAVGNLEDAEAAYVRTISLDPNNAFYHRIYGAFCLKQGQVEKAIAEYRKALAVYPDDLHDILTECYVILDAGYSILDTGCWTLDTRIESPVSSVQHLASSICPQDARSHTTLARFWKSKGWYGAASSEYGRAIALAPKQTYLWRESGDLLVGQGKFAEAASLWQQFLESNPRNAQAHAQLAAVYVKQKRLDDAIEQYMMAANIEPNDPSYLVKASDVHIQQGKSDEALKLWRTEIKQNPYTAAGAYYRLGRYHEERGDWVAALCSFQRAIAAEPRKVGYRSHLAESYYRRELFYEAIQEWKEALKLEPENASIHLQLARVYQKINRQDKAEEHYRQVAELKECGNPRTGL